MLLYLATKFPMLWKVRRWIGYGIAALAVVWALWAVVDGYGDRRAKAAADGVRAEWAAATEAANAATKAKDAAYQRASGERDAYAEQVSARLQRPQIDPKTLIVRVPTDAPGITCPDRSPAWRVQYNAIAAGTADR